jgi:hypothetical protein
MRTFWSFEIRVFIEQRTQSFFWKYLQHLSRAINYRLITGAKSRANWSDLQTISAFTLYSKDERPTQALTFVHYNCNIHLQLGNLILFYLFCTHLKGPISFKSQPQSTWLSAASTVYFLICQAASDFNFHCQLSKALFKLKKIPEIFIWLTSSSNSGYTKKISICVNQ